MKIFITGGTGNIGQYVTKALLDAGHELKVYTRTPERIPAIGRLKNVTLVQGDILELEKMGAAVKGCDAVVYIALGWGNTPVEFLNNDTKSTLYLLETAEKEGVKNFVYTSSTSVYGNAPDNTDENSPLVPNTLYGATKAATEKYILGFRQYNDGQGVRGRKSNIRSNIIRPGYTFSNPAFEGGASQSDKRFRDIARSALKNEDMVIAEDSGTQFISSAQIAQLYLKVTESDLDMEVFLGLGDAYTSWADIARMAIACVPGCKSKVLSPEGHVQKKPHRYNVDKIKKYFGFAFDATEELREHVKWNVEREKKVLAGDTVHNVYHVW